MKVLFFDVETAPLLAYVWRLSQDYINPQGVISESFMLSWSAKWSGHKSIKSDVLTSTEALAQDDSRIVASLADLLREADIVVAHNGDDFDMKVVNGRVLANSLEPLGPIQTIDTKKIARSSFKFASNSLDYLATQVLGREGKIKTDFDLWQRCYNGDAKALKEMVRYNKQDVVILEEVFEAMKPYVKRLPRMTDTAGIVCPYCGSRHLQRRGYYRTKVSNFAKYQCQSCLRYSRFKSGVAPQHVRAI